MRELYSRVTSSHTLFKGTRNERSNEVLTSKRLGFELLRPLVESMTQADPSQRPVIDHAKSQFDEIMKSLSQKTLRSRLVRADEEPGMGPWLNIGHAFRTFRYRLLRKPAIPVPV